MYILISIAILLAFYALYVARSAHSRFDSSPRSFHLTLTRKSKDGDGKIQFYVLYLSGARVFLDQQFESVNITPKMNISSEIANGKFIECWSEGDFLRWRYVLTDNKKEHFESGDELSLSLLSLPKSVDSSKSIEAYLKQEGWESKRALFTDDLYFVKDNLEVYLTYVS